MSFPGLIGNGWWTEKRTPANTIPTMRNDKLSPFTADGQPWDPGGMMDCIYNNIS